MNNLIGREAGSHGLKVLLIAAGMVPLTTAAQTAGDACALLSSEEIAQFLGERVGTPRPETAEEGTACRFPAGGNSLVIRLWPTDARGFEEVRGTLDDSGAQRESATGIGDAAYYSGDRIYARKGTQALSVFFEGAEVDSQANRRDVVTAIAKAGLAKLQ